MDILEFLNLPHSATWHEQAGAFFNEQLQTRYGANASKHVAVRNPKLPKENTPFAAVLHRDSPTSGGYSGTSFVVFPASEGPALIALVVGTQGLAPDENILARPGHARLCAAIANWTRGKCALTAWAKTDPTRIDINAPKEVVAQFERHADAFNTYGHVMYLVIDPASSSNEKVTNAFLALLDFYMRERGSDPLASHRSSAQSLRSAYERSVFPKHTESWIANLLKTRRFVILQGPPGTGKTRLALRLLANEFADHGMRVQFHPSVGYEQFVGGLAPVETDGQFGFKPRAGWLMEAVAAATKAPGSPYLLLIDEINRADLAKVLGEAIYLFEAKEPNRKIDLAYNFEAPWNAQLGLPSELCVLGTMNSADRSIAVLDLAIRRRFAFLTIWPDEEPLTTGSKLALQAFQSLRNIFLSQATDEQLELLPGHAYFLAATDEEAKLRITTELMPLLNDYIQQGLIAGFSEDIEGYLQWLHARLH
jgi:5-methylcytosine-specific restriction enzyme B